MFIRALRMCNLTCTIMLQRDSVVWLPSASLHETDTIEQWLKWFCEVGGSPDEARLEQTPYSFQPH